MQCFTTIIMKRYLLGLLLVVFLVSCKKKDDGVYIPREQFIAVLTDIHLADAYYSTNYEGRKTHNDSVNLYHSVLENYGFTLSQFDTTLKLYTINTKKFDELYEEVITRLNKIEQENYMNRPTDEDMSANLWYGKNSWFLPDEGSRRKIPIDLKLKGKGKYTVTFTYKIYPDDESKNPRLNLYFTTDSAAKPKKDTLKMVEYKKDARTTIVTVTKELKDSTLTRLQGYLLDHDDKMGKWEKHAVIAGLKVFHVPYE